jgi:hypothetical protein
MSVLSCDGGAGLLQPGVWSFYIFASDCFMPRRVASHSRRCE